MKLNSVLQATLLILLLTILASGCYRTRYVGFSPDALRADERVDEFSRERKSGWQHFFVYGWAPGNRVVDAADLCEGGEYIHSIETERRFVQGLIAAFAGYYINIYSPWNGAVYCHAPISYIENDRTRGR